MARQDDDNDIYLPLRLSRMRYMINSKHVLIRFSFHLTGYTTKVEVHSLPYYLSMAWGRKNWFILFLMELAENETPIVSSRIWTRVAVFIFNNSN